MRPIIKISYHKLIRKNKLIRLKQLIWIKVFQLNNNKYLIIYLKQEKIIAKQSLNQYKVDQLKMIISRINLKISL